MTTDRYVEELTALAKSGKPVSEALVQFEQIFDAYMIETHERRFSSLSGTRLLTPRSRGRSSTSLEGSQRKAGPGNVLFG
jgi:hypothetical protein